MWYDAKLKMRDRDRDKIIEIRHIMIKQEVDTSLINNTLLVMWFDFVLLKVMMTELFLDMIFFTVG